MRRRAPRPLGLALKHVAAQLQPSSPLAEIQQAWDSAVGSGVAKEALPTGERDGVLTVSCKSSVWAHELELMAPQVIDRINARVGDGRVRSLRCRTGPEAFSPGPP